MAGRIRAGMAGWVFPEWRGGQFYPEGLKQKDELGWASRNVTTIEINATFYRNQKPESFAAWAAQTPEDFVFTVKGNQTVTHIKRLKDVEAPLELFFNSVAALGSRLGAVCWQLPGNMKFDRDRVAAFLALLPTGIRQAVEARSPGFAEPAFLDLLAEHNVALVTADTADWPWLDQTADFTYARLQGPPDGDSYGEAGLDRWAGRFATLAAGTLPEGQYLQAGGSPQPERDVFAFFVSADKPNAPRNAMGLQRRLGITAAG